MRIYLIALMLVSNLLYAKEWSLSDLPLTVIDQGWGVPQRDRNLLNSELSVGKEKYTKGIASHAPGGFTLILDGGAKKFTGLVGIDDAVNGYGDVIVKFFIIINGKRELLWDSGVLKKGEKAKKFDLNLSGGTELKFEMFDNGDGSYDHLDLLEWKIEYDNKAPQAVFPPGVIETDNLMWHFEAITNRELIQKNFGSKNHFSGAKVGLLTYPARGKESFALDENLRIIQADGAHSLALVVEKVDKTTIADGIEETRFFLRDPEYPIKVEYVILSYKKEDVFKAHIEVINNGDLPIMIINRDSAFTTFEATENSYLTSFYGHWGREFLDSREDKLPAGVVKHQDRGGIQPTMNRWPGILLSLDGKAEEDSGVVFAAALAWSGAWQLKVTNMPPNQYNPKNRLFFSAGVQEDPVKLASKSRYTSPEVVMTFSNQGKGQVSRNYHAYMLRDGLYNPHLERPIILNSWEGVYFDFDEAKIINMIEQAAKLGVEMFVLDDGWFGNGDFQRNSDRAGLGDWQINSKKLPNGLNALISASEKNGIKFGLWVEPEMVNPKSNLFQTHPDWAMQIPKRERYTSRHQYVLDLSKQEVENFVYNSVANILTLYPKISYIKWDFNSSGVNFGSASAADDQGAISDKQTQSYYRIMAKLRKNFPNVMFQACASGGGRTDFGAMKFHEEFWASDQTNGLERIKIQWGYSHFYPPIAIASHIGKYGDGDFKLRVDVAMTGRLGVELSPDSINDENREIINQGINVYKKLRPILAKAELFRGSSPLTSNISDLSYIAKDKNVGVFFGFKRGKEAQLCQLKPKGLNPDFEYKVTEVNAENQARFINFNATGKELMENGISIDFPNKESSVVALIEKIK